MRNFTRFLLVSSLSTLPLLVACGDDSDSDKPASGGSGGTGATGGGGSGGSGGGMAGSGGSMAGSGGSTAGSGGGGTGGATGGTGGTGGSTCDLMATKTVEDLTGKITASKKLTSDKHYMLKGIVTVEAGATLTIDPCTKIMGDKATTGTLVIKQGAKIIADGKKDEPILFTSAAPVGSRAAGDWGGLIVLGKAPTNKTNPTIEGLTTNETYGGTDPADDSGILRFIRIEFGGVEIAANNEINGLTLGGVGNKTVVENIQVKHTLDDCFEFFGGTVNAKRLVCFRNGDDGLDFDFGYSGKVQFYFHQSDPSLADEANGFEWDTDGTNFTATPPTNPTVYNATLCGQNAVVAKQQYGMLLRRGVKGKIVNAIVTGFEGGVDLRDVPPTSVELMNSVFFGNAPENIAYVEDGSNSDTKKDDDKGFDEIGWFNTSGWNNTTNDPKLAGCFAATPNPIPASVIPGATPPSDGFFDATASYAGAFKDAAGNWMTGKWVDWADK